MTPTGTSRPQLGYAGPMHTQRRRRPAQKKGHLVWLALLAGCGDGEAVAGRGGIADPRGNGTGQNLCSPSPSRCEKYGSERPFRPAEHTAIHVPETGEMISFGGSRSLPTAECGPGPAEYIDETWIYSEGCNAWAQVMASGPSARSRHTAAYGAGTMWVFGGRFRAEGSTNGDFTLFDELWAFDTEAHRWNMRKPAGEAPSARINSAMAWDSKRKRLWLFSGNESPEGFSYTFVNDIWSFDPDDGSWRLHEPSGVKPSARVWHSLLYDRARDWLVLYGGMDARGAPSGYLSDIYALDLDSLEWEELNSGTIDAPAERFWGSLVYDSEREDYLLFGGHDATELGNRNDTYRFDPESKQWHLVQRGDSYNEPPNGICDFPPDFANVDVGQPERRHAGTMVWSSPCQRALLFGGKSDCGIVDDLWSFEDGTWHLIQAATEGEVCFRWRDDHSRCTSLCQ